MTNDEAEKLALKIRESVIGRSWLQVRDLCDHILSGSMKREIENAAFERAAKLAEDFGDAEEARGNISMAGQTMFEARQAKATARDVATNIRRLITPAKTADTEE